MKIRTEIILQSFLRTVDSLMVLNGIEPPVTLLSFLFLGFKLNRVLNAGFLNHQFRGCLLVEGRVNSVKETTLLMHIILSLTITAAEPRIKES